MQIPLEAVGDRGQRVSTYRRAGMASWRWGRLHFGGGYWGVDLGLAEGLLSGGLFTHA